MPINVVSRGRQGRVFLRDEREDGVVVHLVCEVADDVLEDLLRAPGVIYAPDPPDGGGGTFPMPKNLVPPGGPFKLTIDTSDLIPPGVKQFRLGVFTEAAAQAAADGAVEIRLGPETAKHFGIVGSLAIAGEGGPVVA